MRKKETKAIVLKMPKKLVGTETIFPIAYVYDGSKVQVAITNNPAWTHKIEEIIVVYK